jgi:hypothetical protein
MSDINSQIHEVINKHSALVAAEIGQLFGQAFKNGASALHLNGASNGMTNGTAHAAPTAKKASKAGKAPKAKADSKASGKTGGKTKAAKVPRAKKLKPGEKRDPKILEALVESLYTYVKEHPDERIEKIAEGMKMSTRELNLPLRKLIKSKRVTKKGLKRATTYTAKD